ncbi:MAG: hypothetical protein KGL39_14640 [Patescibacteria group bacterium]|nr:hypothetical protein [Patescibacteria group bacterium]
MTRKDYILLAAALKPRTAHNPTDPDTCAGWHMGVSACIHAIADALASDNPLFDRARFLKAAGVQS